MRDKLTLKIYEQHQAFLWPPDRKLYNAYLVREYIDANGLLDKKQLQIASISATSKEEAISKAKRLIRSALE